MEEKNANEKALEEDAEVDDKIETVDVKIEYDDNPPEPEPEAEVHPEVKVKTEERTNDNDSEGAPDAHNEGNGSSENDSSSRRRSSRRHVSTPAYVDDFVSDTLLHIEPEGEAFSTDSDDEYRPEYPTKVKTGKSNKKITPKRKFETMTFVDPNSIQSANGAQAASEDDTSQPSPKKKMCPDGAFTPLKIQSPSVFKIKKQLLQRPIPTHRFQPALSPATSATGWSLIRSTLKEAKAASEVFHYKADNLTRTVDVKAVNNIENIVMTVRKTLELLETSRNDVINIENKFHRMIRNFVKNNQLEFHFNKVSEIRKILKGHIQQQPQQQHQRNDSDSDCEILEPKINNELSDTLKKIQQRHGIILKSTNVGTTLKDEHTIALPNKVIHFGKDIAIKRVSSIPKDHFFWLDGRTLKPPDSKYTRRPVELRNVSDFASWSSKIGWLDLAFETVGDRFVNAQKDDSLNLYYTNCDVNFSERIYLLSEEMYDRFCDNRSERLARLNESCKKYFENYDSSSDDERIQSLNTSYKKSVKITDKLVDSPPSLFLSCCLALYRFFHKGEDETLDMQNENDLSKLKSFENRMKLYMKKYEIDGSVNYKMLLNKKDDTELKLESPLENSDSSDSSDDDSFEEEELIENEPITVESNLIAKNLLLEESSSSEIDESESETDEVEEPSSTVNKNRKDDNIIANKKPLKSITDSSSSESEEDYVYTEVEKGDNSSEKPISNVEEINPDKNLPDNIKKAKKIRQILSDDLLKKETKIAIRDEKERLERLAEKNSLIPNLVDSSESIVLDMDKSSKEPILVINPMLSKFLKAHQIEGVRFMWDSCFESVEAVKSGKPGSGSILAHCMGLGKTLQVITLIHTIMNCKELSSIHSILILCPMTTIFNWVDEFKKWLNKVNSIKTINIIELSRYRKNKDRVIIFDEWQKKGGVLLLGYEMFRTLVGLKVEKDVKQQYVDKIRKVFVNPGPDLVICDEGHLLKNYYSLLSERVNLISTKRRIVLTGTPLQNNLNEYYCMVNFVKPNLLGTQKEFINRFQNPITNGQHRDSNKKDIKLMKNRSHVLHKLLEGSVQRKEALILYECLPKKEEYVIFITLSTIQAKLYQLYLNSIKICENLKRKLFHDFHQLYKIWSHPRLLFQKEKIPDWLLVNEQLVLDTSQIDKLDSSHKFVVTFSILEECLKTEDKLVIFCTHLGSLDAIEYYLALIKSWKHGIQYYRLDGNVVIQNRRKMCKSFNSTENRVTKLLLVSTRVGGLGINLTGANRVIILDVSWNPSHDIQSIFRVYRFGQTKPCYIYRLVTSGTMEEKIYERSVTKQAVSCRVVDEHQIDRHYDMAELTKLYSFTHVPDTVQPVPMLPSDNILKSVLTNLKNTVTTNPPYIWNVHEHDSLLKNLQEEQLDENERLAAWAEYEQEQLIETAKPISNLNVNSQPTTSTSAPVVYNYFPNTINYPYDNYYYINTPNFIPYPFQTVNSNSQFVNILPKTNPQLHNSVIKKTKHYVPIAAVNTPLSPPKKQRIRRRTTSNDKTPTKNRESIDLTNLPETPEAKKKRLSNKRSSRRKSTENDKNKSNTPKKKSDNNYVPSLMLAKRLDFNKLPNIETTEKDPTDANLYYMPQK